MPWDTWVIFLVLGLVLPWRGRARMKKLLALPQVTTMERLILYASTTALQWLNLRRVGRIPVGARGPIQAIAERLLPQSAVELLPYLALAITAGLCEEFLYRGFVMAVLLRVGLQAWAVVVLSSVLFGLAHSYQGRGGIVMTLLIGLILGTSRLAYGSLVPAVFWHSAVDVVAGTAGPRYLTPKTAGVQEKENLIHQD